MFLNFFGFKPLIIPKLFLNIEGAAMLKIKGVYLNLY